MKKLFESRLSLLLVVIALSAGTYINTVHNGFIIDDHFLIEKNPWITSFKNLPAIFTSDVHAFKTENPATDYYRPILFTVYTLEYLLFGLKPWGWHLVNVLLHTANSVLVFLIASYLSGAGGRKAKNTHESREGALKPVNPNAFPLISALIFAVHPMNTEAVNWLACVCELSYTLFSLLAFYLYMLSTDSGYGPEKHHSAYRILSVLCFLLAAFSKETALVVPGILLAYDYARRMPYKGFLKRHVFHWAAFGVYILLRIEALHGIVPAKRVSAELLYYLSSVFIIFPHYLRLFLFPADLNLYHIITPALSWTDPGLFFSAAVTTAFFIFLWRVSKKERLAVLPLSLVTLPLFPTFYLLTKNTDIYYINIMAERFFYLPMAGVAMLISLGAEHLATKARTVKAVSLLFISIFVAVSIWSALSFVRNRFWKDDYTIFKTSSQYYPDNYFIHYMLGDLYNSSGRIDLAIEEFTAASRLRPSFTGSHHKLGLIYYSMGLPGAESEFREVLKTDPENGDAHYNIGLIFMDSGRWDEAIEQFKKTITYSRGSRVLSARNALAVSYARVGRLKDAKRELQEALRQNPADKETTDNFRALEKMTPSGW